VINLGLLFLFFPNRNDFFTLIPFNNGFKERYNKEQDYFPDFDGHCLFAPQRALDL
jgi:hypothetical protein